MKVSQAVSFWINYHKTNSADNTIRAYQSLLTKFCHENGNKDLKELTSEEILEFLDDIIEGNKPQTKKTWFAQIAAFFNFAKNNIDQDFQNPCDNPIIKKMYKAKASTPWDHLNKHRRYLSM